MSAVAADLARRKASPVASPVASTRTAIICFACLGLLLQALIESSLTNLATALIASMSSILTALYIFRRNVMSTTPISSIIVFGLSFTLLLGPLVFQTLDWRPIAYNLDAPIMAVAIAAFASLLACLTHAIYRAFPPFGLTSQALAGSVHTALFVFRAPNNGQLWLMGVIGLIATFLTGTAQSGGSINYGDVVGKFWQAFTPFVLAPALIPVAPYLFRTSKSSNLSWFLVSIYYVFIIALSIAKNSRGSLATIIVMLILCLCVAVWRGNLKITKRMGVIAFSSMIIGLPIMGAFSDLSTAMLINRSIRSDVSAATLIERTIDTASDKDALQNYRTRTSVISNRYNEIYIRNDFLQRLTLLKFLDLNMKTIQGINESQRDYAQYIFKARLIASLPTPAIRLLGLDVDKSALQFSGGDLYRFLAASGATGGFATGASLADGLAIMGVLFWPFFMGLALVSFVIYDAFVYPWRG